MNNQGKLYVRYGPMFASKTLYLVDNLNRYADLGFSVVYINNSVDNRSDNGISTNCSGGVSLSDKVAKFSIEDLYMFYLEDWEKYKVIGVDEAQFHDNLIQPILKWVEQNNKIVYAVGLDLNAKRKKWGDILDLAGQADDTQKLTAKCKDCLDESKSVIEAPFTSKLDPGGQDIEIGGADKYIAVCRFHWIRRNDRYLL